MNQHDLPQDPLADLGFETRAVRAGIERTQFGEHAEPLFLTSSFVFTSAAQAAARFNGDEEGFVYSRFSNPTVQTFQDRLASLEGAEACLATSSGMSAILAVVMGVVKGGEHIVSSAGVFGATAQLFNMFGRYGVQTTYVPLTDAAAWEAAVRPETKMFYLETPSNPLTEIADLDAISAVAKRHGILLVVDNCFSTPVLQRPLSQGADVVVHSATKYIDGQGRVLGGAVLGSQKFIDECVLPVLRTAGPTLSAFNAWVLLKGLETLSVRMEKQCANALEVARWLEAQPGVARHRRLPRAVHHRQPGRRQDHDHPPGEHHASPHRPGGAPRRRRRRRTPARRRGPREPRGHLRRPRARPGRLMERRAGRGRAPAG